MRVRFCFAVLFAVVLCPLSASATVYTFEGLSAGNLPGQDNWVGDALVVATGVGFNTSQVATPGAPDTTRIAERTNDGNYSFPTLSATGQYYFEFDFMTSEVDAGDYQAVNFTLNKAGDSGLPNFGVDGIGATNNVFYIRAASGTESSGGTIGSAPGVDNGNWLRLRLTVDFAANAGAGSGSYSYKNLTDGDAGYTNVAGLQNINLGITSAPTPNVALWDTMRLRMRKSGEVIAHLQVDNLSVAAVPEPSALALLGLAGIGLLAWRRR